MARHHSNTPKLFDIHNLPHGYTRERNTTASIATSAHGVVIARANTGQVHALKPYSNIGKARQEHVDMLTAARSGIGTLTPAPRPTIEHDGIGVLATLYDPTIKPLSLMDWGESYPGSSRFEDRESLIASTLGVLAAVHADAKLLHGDPNLRNFGLRKEKDLLVFDWESATPIDDPDSIDTIKARGTEVGKFGAALLRTPFATGTDRVGTVGELITKHYPEVDPAKREMIGVVALEHLTDWSTSGSRRT